MTLLSESSSPAVPAGLSFSGRAFSFSVFHFLVNSKKSCIFATSNTPKPARVGGGRQDILKRRCNSVLSAANRNFATSLVTAITQCSTSMVVCSLYAIYVTRGLRHCLFCNQGQCEGLYSRDKQSSRFPRFFLYILQT